ncbi:NACHT domain-containing NTPase [Nocardiopsis sp. YSL2]|uniref:NACHT domain-containing protein n=1 Tax=Nocardiopsis sp. YSL2 TaxID=2939492 RepID=UPI0026F4169F|nr:ATP-binding protein [Nocardiopsis sp. YSL2]
MAKQLTYADALKALGGNDSEVLDLAEKLTDGGLGLVGVPDLFGARGALVSKGRQALEGMAAKLKGESRLSRTAKIQAAHHILVLVAFFEAVEESLGEVGAPFSLADLEFTREEQVRLLDSVLTHSGSLPVPSLGSAWAPRFFSDFLLRSFTDVLLGLAVAEEHGIASDTHPLLEALRDAVPGRAAQRYQESYRLLAADIPEFGMWVHMDEHERTRRTVGTGLLELSRALEAVGSRREVDGRRRELAAGYQAVLRQPVLRADDAPARLALPALEDAYVPPRGRAGYAVRSGTPSAEEWWEELPVDDDLQDTVAAHLVHPVATEVPTVILGHPGAGKSKLTEMLAARLPAADFLPIRVELRSVPPNSPIHVQIEEGLAAALHTRVSWRELAESADGALPVIILDGFDELLQATGVDRSDYLERVQEFQHQQEALGQPVAVIVTSRTVVADRTRFPDGTLVMRLEPFDEAQIARMLQVWNRANALTFVTAGLMPLTTDVLLRYRELAEQPLLLLMLLIYDAADNALRAASETLSHGQLYERLLTMFARREVDKHRSGLSRDDLDAAVEDELRRLEVAALAMFTRRRQSVSADDLGQDLDVLMPDAPVRPAEADLHGRIAPAHQVLGRFFFVHESRARAADGNASAFEFLHATFGEYLVARAVVTALEVVEESRPRPSRRRGRNTRTDDGELYALSSFASYAGRDRVVAFLDELLQRRLAGDPGLREDYAALLLELFREAPFPAPNRSLSDHEPTRLPQTKREAYYTSNLMILLCLVRENPVDARELFPDAPEPDQALQHVTSLWRTLAGSEWFSIVSALRVRHLNGWDEDGPVTLIRLEDGSPVDVGECVGFEIRANQEVTPSMVDPYGITVPYKSTTSRLLRSTAMRVNGTAARFTLGLLPYLRHVSSDLATWYLDPHRLDSWTELHEILRLRLEPVTEDPDGRVAGYRRLLSQRSLGRIELVVLRQAAEDLALLARGTEFRESLLEVLRSYLSNVESIVAGPALHAGGIGGVLDMLSHQVSPDWTSRVRKLAAENDTDIPYSDAMTSGIHSVLKISGGNSTEGR